jgi:hypothetical protein
MASLLSGSMLRRGGSGEFIDLPGAQPQLPDSISTTTGFTLITNSLLQTRYVSSLGNIEFGQANMYSNLSTGTITILATGTVSQSLSTASGTLVVTGGVGIGRNLWVKEDIHVNDLTIGRGYEGANNIVFRGTATLPPYEDTIGNQNIAIGYDTLNGIASSYGNIAIGRYALSSGTNLTNSIAVGDKALQNIGITQYIPVANISGATQANPVVITTVLAHGLISGNNISITGVVGMTELNNNSYYVQKVSPTSIRLYSDVILSQPIDGTGYSGYTSSGKVNRNYLKNNNIAFGTNAGGKLIDGEYNTFFGNQVARNLTTGSYNFFAGVGGTNITTGSNNISINGSNIVSGLDNQINFGSVFYYNGQGFANLNANTEIGLDLASTNSDSGALTVHGGAGISGDVHIGGVTSSTNIATGALTVAGGTGIAGNVNIGKELNVLGSGKVDLSPSNYNVYLQPTGAGLVTIAPASKGSIDNMTIGLGSSAGASFTYASITNTTLSTSTTTGALTVSGGVGIRGEVYSRTGIPDENYLLYTPRVTVTAGVAPTGPRIGDIWIDASVPAYLQYIKDGTSTFWIQVGAV